MTTVEVTDSTREAEAVSSEELIARAEEIARTLVSQQASTEERTYYSQETHEAFARAGLYRLLTPKRYGGYEVDLGTYFRVAMAIARGCPSTGWCYTLGTSHALAAASYFPQQAQDEVFAGTDFICPLTAKPMGTARHDGDSWIINATFAFCSGAPYATHYIGHTIPEDEEQAPLMFIAPRSSWTMLDDWGGQMGLKGSGSQSIQLTDARIPEYFAMPHTDQLLIDPRGGTFGSRLHGNSMYAGSTLSFFIIEIAVLAVGIAQGALDEYGEMMRTKNTPIPPLHPRKDNIDYQRWYGTASGQIETAKAAILNAIQQWEELAAADGFNPIEDHRLVTIAKEVIELSWRAVADSLVRSAGSTSMRNGERIERVFRDLATLHSHNGVVMFGELATRGVAQLEFAE